MLASTLANDSVETGTPQVGAPRSGVGWRATVDEDGQYCFAVAP
jgi:hypothetical protein